MISRRAQKAVDYGLFAALVIMTLAAPVLVLIRKLNPLVPDVDGPDDPGVDVDNISYKDN